MVCPSYNIENQWGINYLSTKTEIGRPKEWIFAIALAIDGLEWRTEDGFKEVLILLNKVFYRLPHSKKLQAEPILY